MEKIITPKEFEKLVEKAYKFLKDNKDKKSKKELDDFFLETEEGRAILAVEIAEFGGDNLFASFIAEYTGYLAALEFRNTYELAYFLYRHMFNSELFHLVNFMQIIKAAKECDNENNKQ